MGFFDILKLILPLLLLIGLLYGLLLLVKRIQFKGSNISNSNIKVIHTLVLMPKKYLSFVKINNKVFVLGLSEQSISLIKELDSSDFTLSNESEQSSATFSDYFKNLIKR
ncbi:MAG: flagellar biosynthetic protein FliO [Ignavibacterium sp.]|nr:flagellar biosynthetic protein FliO [Ignavibacterium sp.]MDW8374133.1 flagellar biosynthetic protein FliO [Ignavibacteriales bacterium]